MKLKYQRSTAALRRIRQKIFDYPEHKEAQANRVLGHLKTRKLRDIHVERANETKGPFSGLTRRELVASRTSETDWF
jgi:hypothetical protein